MFNGKLRIWDINNIVTAGELYGDELFAATVSSTDSYGEFINCEYATDLESQSL